jgi:ribosome-binding protein aMBF1 (putative translation factor)
MGKHSAGMPGSRSEPYNQPIRVYGISGSEGKSNLRKIMDEIELGLRDRQLELAIDVRVGANIRLRREQKGLTVEQFARRLQMSSARLREIEAGKERLTLVLVQRIATALGYELFCVGLIDGEQMRGRARRRRSTGVVVEQNRGRNRIKK